MENGFVTHKLFYYYFCLTMYWKLVFYKCTLCSKVSSMILKDLFLLTVATLLLRIGKLKPFHIHTALVYMHNNPVLILVAKLTVVIGNVGRTVNYELKLQCEARLETV